MFGALLDSTRNTMIVIVLLLTAGLVIFSLT